MMQIPPGIKLYPHQKLAINQLKTGSILCGGVGSGKTRTAIAYFYINEMPKDLYIITTAAKRDTLDWERESSLFMLSTDKIASIMGVQIKVDSWNNIKKYIDIKNSFFIFDEQRVIGSGVWVKSFLKITKNNNWILLSATPGDTWLDYIPVFIANGFFKNRMDFIRNHVSYNTFVKFPKVDHYIAETKLKRLKNNILVNMDYIKPTKSFYKDEISNYDKNLFNLVYKDRWNPYKDLPIKGISELCFLMRKVVNSDPSRFSIIKNIIERHRKIIIFYNFNYELEILKKLKNIEGLIVNEYNGHRHDKIPDNEYWVYLVQYLSGSEGWNCISSNTIIFYSLNYSYRIMTQAAGRIDRLNTPYTKLYYYNIFSESIIDLEIRKALKNKKNFNENFFSRK